MDAMKAAAAIAALNAAAQKVSGPQSDLSPLHSDQLKADSNELEKVCFTFRVCSCLGSL